MDKRTSDLLSLIIGQYISAGRPIGSLYLVEKLQLEWSSATIRNIMALLENEGYMYQPHSSAGRIPTEVGYQTYVKSLKPARLSLRSEVLIREAIKIFLKDPSLYLYTFAQFLSDFCEDIAFVTVGTKSMCWKGMRYLIEKQEFGNREFVTSLFEMLDSFDTIVQDVYPQVTERCEVWIGKENRVAPSTSAMIMKYHSPKGEGLIGLLGPMRMNYAKNISVMRVIEQMLNNEQLRINN